MKYLFSLLLLLAFFSPQNVSAQSTPEILIDGNTASADPVSGVKFPLWLKAGQTLAASTDVTSISVVEFSINGTALDFSNVISVTTSQAVPANKAWKLESVVFASSSSAPSNWNLLGNNITGTDFVGTTNNQDLVFKTNNLEAMRVAVGGNVGIGTVTPTAKLEINGQIKITGGTPGAGKTLVSDAAGLASWSTQTGITGTGTNNVVAKFTSATTVGNSIIFDNGTNVGIGAAAVSDKLEVNGRIKDITGYVAPVGSIMLYGGATAPAGWLLCDGASLARAGTYADLFAVLGTTYGAVDGSSFSVPDLRQRFPLGKATSGTGAALGATGGSIDHVHTTAPVALTVAQLPPHSHTLTDNGVAMRAQDGSSGGNYGTAQRVSGGTTSFNMVIGTTGSGDTHGHGDTGQNNPPFLSVNYIIKY